MKPVLLNSYYGFQFHKCIFHFIDLKTRYIEKKYPYSCVVMTMYQALLMGTSVSTFLCTRKLGPEEVSVNLIDELTQVLLQGSK